MGQRKKGKTQTTDGADFWGGCPTCGRNDGYLNLGRQHWFICHAHRVRWLRGENMFSTWRNETEADWQANHQRIGSYDVVEPVYPES